MHIPTATYRIQFTPSFNFHEGKKIVEYLAQLGISDIYASPIFTAKKGSSHGYDIVNPLEINPELGGMPEFISLVATVKQFGMGWLQDIVFNHMAIATENSMLMDIIEYGSKSPYYHFFDINWNHIYEGLRGRLLLPVLGQFYAESLLAGEIQLCFEEKGLRVQYYDLKLPLTLESYPKVLEHNIDQLEKILGKDNPDYIKYLGAIHFLKTVKINDSELNWREQVMHGKRMVWQLYHENGQIRTFIDNTISLFNGKKGDAHSYDLLDALISQQLFRISFWKVATEEINYRRFFTVNDLISLRVENDEVMNHTHQLVFKLVEEGVIQGLRIDHIDGFYDPTQYLVKLREATGDVYIVVEKILARDERINGQWPVQGTTGYDFISRVNGIFIDTTSQAKMTQTYNSFIGAEISYPGLVFTKKMLILGKHMAGYVDNLAQLMKQITSTSRYGRDITLYGLKRALVEVMSRLGVYRTYIDAHSFSEKDRAYLSQAVSDAREHLPGSEYELKFIEHFLLLKDLDTLSEGERDSYRNFIMQFQQYTGPLMAKGVEDTVFYIYNRLISLNEVGDDPQMFGVKLDEFHAFHQERARQYAHSLNATATHDTKRGEDVRARIAVLSEIPDEWKDMVYAWKKINAQKKTHIKQRSIPDDNDEYFFYQTLIGIFPFDGLVTDEFRERVRTYVIKAVREAKVHTAWIKPDQEYETTYLSFVDLLLKNGKDNSFLDSFIPFQKKVAFYGIFNSLAQVILKMTCPGIPDFYQGSELWDFSLVDPDNRRPVDFAKRKNMLQELVHHSSAENIPLIHQLWNTKEDGRIKLYTVYKLLTLRRRFPDFFQKSDYRPVEVKGKFKDCVLAFTRSFNQMHCLVVVPRFLTRVVTEQQFPVGGVWEDTALVDSLVSGVSWYELLSARTVGGRNPMKLEVVFSQFPFAVFLNQEVQ